MCKPHPPHSHTPPPSRTSSYSSQKTKTLSSSTPPSLYPGRTCKISPVAAVCFQSLRNVSFVFFGDVKQSAETQRRLKEKKGRGGAQYLALNNTEGTFHGPSTHTLRDIKGSLTLSDLCNALCHGTRNQQWWCIAVRRKYTHLFFFSQH